MHNPSSPFNSNAPVHRHLCASLSLGVLLWGIGDGEVCEDRKSDQDFGQVSLELSPSSPSLRPVDALQLQVESSHTQHLSFTFSISTGQRTRWQRLLQLLGLLGIL